MLDDDDAPGRVFWLAVFFGLPLVGFAVAVLLFALIRPIYAFWLTGVADHPAAAPADQLSGAAIVFDPAGGV